MFQDIVFILAALATIAAFLLEAWRTWKEYRPDRKRSDDIGEKNSSGR